MLKTYHIALACVILAVVVLLFGGGVLEFGRMARSVPECEKPLFTQ